MTPQKKALQAIRETGQAQGAAKATMASLERKGHIRAKGAGWELTKRGASYLEGKLGNAANLKPAKRGKVKNPSGYGDHGPEERAALKKARAFFGDDSLVTQPKPLRGYVAPNAAVEIGELVAIEYDSNKFDGEPRIYRHDVTKKRKMFISIDGSTIIIQPPLKVTKRGIEG